MEEVRLFGSLAEGRAVPGSDADLLLILKETEISFPERSQLYLDYFVEVGLPCDLFCYTREELEKIPFAREAFRRSIPLMSRKSSED